MELNFGYDISYCVFRLVTKIDMSLMCIFLIMIYVSFMLD
jgi:hypothetical protein